MKYALIQNNAVIEYPFNLNTLRKLFPKVSLPKSYDESALATLGVYSVKETPVPDHDTDTQIVDESDPVNIDGIWVQQWAIRNKTTQEHLEHKRSRREPIAIARVKSMLNIPAIQRIKTLQDAHEFVNSQVTDLETAKTLLSRLTFIVTNLGRHVHIQDDELFPNDE